MKSLFFVIALLISGFVAFGETVSVDYIDGKVEMLSNAKWIKINSGDSIDSGASVRLSSGSLMEFEYNGAKISIVEEGTYSIKALISSSKEVKSWNLLTIVGGKLAKTIATSEGTTGSAALGVRGDPAKVEGLEWVTDEGETDKLQLAKSYISDGKFEDAITVLDSFSGAEPSEQKEVKYYLAYSHAMLGETALALSQINKSGIKAEDPFYADFVLLKGKLLLEGLSYKNALSLFEEYLASAKQDPSVQTVLILESFCYKGTGDKVRQKESLAKAEKLDPLSSEGAQARKLLDTLK
jgi:hypothetical protein